MPSPVTNAPVHTNGASSLKHSGNNSEQTANGQPGKVGSMANGTIHEEDTTRSPATSIEEGKQKAKAVMAASGLAAQDTTEPTTSSRTSSPGANGVHVNGTPQSSSQTRKRSRDGELIQSPTQTPSKPNPPRTEEMKEKILLEQYVHRELSHTAAICDDDRTRIEVMERIKAEANIYKQYPPVQRSQYAPAFFGLGYAGYGNSIQDTQGRGTIVILPSQRKRPFGRKSKELRISRKDRDTQAEQLDELVPIRLDIEFDKFRIRDTFTWNLHDRTVPLESFARHLVEDFGLSLPQCEPLVQQIYHSMQEQILDFHPHVHIDEAPLDPHLPYNAYKNDDMRVVINLNITIGQNTLVDKFEWEINNPSNSPEDFAQQMTRDLSLSGEFTTAIAHSIREQSQLFTKSLYVTGHPFDGRPVEDHELSSSFCPTPMSSSFRPFQAAKDFTPYLYELNEAELEKTELSLSREERRQKRSVNRRGGPALPDLKDRRRTNRTLVVSTVIPGAVENIEDSRLLKRTAASSKARRGAARDGGEESDDSDSEDSLPGSPAMPNHLLSGTARTRGMRGAASAAQAALRANVGRSATPESMTSHHHEPRASARRVIRDEASSPEPTTSLIIKLKISRAKLQQIERNQRAKTKEMSQTPAPRPTSRNSSAAPGSMGPPSASLVQAQVDRSNGGTPEKSGHHSTSTPSKSTTTPQTSKHGATSNLGRIDATGPPGPDHPIPQPPTYLKSALQTLQSKYPDDLFEGTMRYTAVSTETDEPFTLRPDGPTPPNTKYCYYPRIKCKDCPGKLYTPDVTLGVNNFEVHLKNRNHRERVAKRLEEFGKAPRE